MSLTDNFQEASERIRGLSKKPDNDTLLSLYSLFKQGSIGPAEGKRPGRLQMVARAKFDSWAELGDMSCEKAMQEYIALVDKLLEQDRLS